METYTLKLTKDQLNVIEGALQNLPFRLVAPLFNEIFSQLAAQEEATVKPTEPPTPSPVEPKE